MTTVGIDLSINSTSLCIDEDGKLTYHLIVPHITKKQQKVNDSNRNVLIHLYNKDTLSINLKEICLKIEDILCQIECNHLVFEAISFGSNGRVVDLALLAGYIRSVCDHLNISYDAIPPTSVKKFFVANGQADKELMIKAWSMVDPDTYNLTIDIKQDDLADSYAMCQLAKQIYLNTNANNQ